LLVMLRNIEDINFQLYKIAALFRKKLITFARLRLGAGRRVHEFFF
ncbi:hypothetical protein GWI33_021740, partial [Rhynchophorus ferrugineus]